MRWVNAIAIVAWLAPAPVIAAGTRLEYTRAPGAEACPEPAALRASMVSRLGYDPFSDAGARVLHCQIAPNGNGLRARIDVEDAQGRVAGLRVLTSKRGDCVELAPALLLVMSLAARESAADAPVAPEPAPHGEVKDRASTSARADPPPCPARPPRRSARAARCRRARSGNAARAPPRPRRDRSPGATPSMRAGRPARGTPRRRARACTRAESLPRSPARAPTRRRSRSHSPTASARATLPNFEGRAARL